MFLQQGIAGRFGVAQPAYIQQPQYIQQQPRYIQQPQYIQQQPRIIQQPQYIQQQPRIIQQPQYIIQQEPVQYIQQGGYQPSPYVQPQAPVVPDEEQAQRINQWLDDDDHGELKQIFTECWDAVHGGDGKIDPHEMHALAQIVDERLQLPVAAFGTVDITFEKFDFDGNGSLSFKEAYKCVKRCLADYRNDMGFAPEVIVPSKTPEEAGYTLIKVLAHGGQGEARLVQNSEGKEVVLKQYDRANANAGGIEELKDEMAHMQMVDKHPNIANCYEIFQDPMNFYMVTDANYGGDWASIKEKATEAGVQMTEDWFRDIFTQAWQGLAYMHRNALMHCDIKEPNLMVRNTDYSKPHVVIIDLGMAKSFSIDMSGGTPGYMPPEVVDLFAGGQGAWYPKGDIFSMGVVCFQLLTDNVPNEKTGTIGIFQGPGDWMQITKTKRPAFESIQSLVLREWLQKCLEKNRRMRYTAPQVLDHPWFRGRASYHATAQRPVIQTIQQSPVQRYVSAPTQMLQSQFPVQRMQSYTSPFANVAPASPASPGRYASPVAGGYAMPYAGSRVIYR